MCGDRQNTNVSCLLLVVMCSSCLCHLSQKEPVPSAYNISVHTLKIEYVVLKQLQQNLQTLVRPEKHKHLSVDSSYLLKCPANDFM